MYVYVCVCVFVKTQPAIATNTKVYQTLYVRKYSDAGATISVSKKSSCCKILLRVVVVVAAHGAHCMRTPISRTIIACKIADVIAAALLLLVDVVIVVVVLVIILRSQATSKWVMQRNAMPRQTVQVAQVPFAQLTPTATTITTPPAPPTRHCERHLWRCANQSRHRSLATKALAAANKRKSQRLQQAANSQH